MRMSVIDDYNATLSGNEKQIVEHMVGLVRQWYPDTTEELSYNLPTFKYKGKGLIAIVANKKFMSVYPFSGATTGELAELLKEYECTTGSIHFTTEHPIPDELLKIIVEQRVKAIG